jgi:alcohol dehydrogenase
MKYDTVHLNHAAFDYQGRTRIVYGVHTAGQIGELARGLGGHKVLLVTDPGIMAAGHAPRIQKHLEADGLTVVLFPQVEENPTTRVVDECVALAKESKIDLIVAVGGGSSMDAAKGCNFILTNGGQMKDYWGVGKATKPMLPLIAIPTTAGTGSECQSFALIADEHTHQKMACGDPKAAARVAILDPSLTVSQPRLVTQCTGIDALSHAIETAVTSKRNPMSWLFSRESFQMIVHNLPEVLQDPNNMEARAQMLLGAAYAGTAIENSMLGAAHSCANPLTAHYGIIHGRAVGMMLPHIVRFNAHVSEVGEQYALLMKTTGLSKWSVTPAEAVESLVEKLGDLLDLASIPRRLSDYGIHKTDVAMLAQEAARQWTAQFNPRPVTVHDFQAIYTRAL